MADPRRRTALRLLLLVVVAVGIASMHTLGHRSGHGGPGGHATEVSGHQPAVAGLERAMMAGVESAATAAAAGFDPFTVCLAILAAGLVLLLMALRPASGRPQARRHDRHVEATLGNAGRGPPPPSPFGLRLADLSVLRT